MILEFLNYKKLLIFMSTFLSVFFIVSFVSAGPVYDDFSDPLINGQKWVEREKVREIAGGKLVLQNTNRLGSTFEQIKTGLSDPTLIHTIESTVTVDSSTSLDTGSGAQSAARLNGFFYNTQSSGGATGDVFAILRMGTRGSGLEAWWDILEFTNDELTTWVQHSNVSLIAPGTLAYDTPYQMKISYEQSTNVFTFTVNGVPGTFDGDTGSLAPWARGPVTNHKGLRVVTGGDAGDGYTSATFDDVEFNGSPYDDFSTPLLDLTKWSGSYLERVRDIANNKVRLNIRSKNSREEETLRFPDNSFNFFEAKLLVKSSSFIAAGANGIVRLAGYYYNEAGTPYDGNKDDVWIQNRITLTDAGTLNAQCSLWRHDDADPWGSGTVIFNQTYTTPISFDTEYTLSIERKGTKFIFKLDDEIYTYNVTTAMHEPSIGQHRQIRARVYGDAATVFTGCYMETTVDDVCIKKGGSMIAPISLLLLTDSVVPIYDDFTAPLINGQKWVDREWVRETVGGALALKVGNTANNNSKRLSTPLFDPSSVHTIESNVTIKSATSVDTGAMSNLQSSARLNGFFYNTNATGSATGDVWAGVFIGDFGSGLKAIWSVEKSLDDNLENFEIVGSGTLIDTGTLSTDTSYPVKISYDQPTNVFTFSVDGQETTFDADTAGTPAPYARGPVTNYKGLNIAAYGANGDGYTSAAFDDVKVNGSAYDDFSTAPLDQTKWGAREAVGEVANGKARLNIQVNGAMDQMTAYFPNNDLNYMEAKCLVESGSVISSGARGIVRLAGYYYNEQGAPYDGEKDDVWIENRITLTDTGTLYAWCQLWRMDTADPWGAGTVLFNQSFTTPINFDTEYTLSIERKGTQFIFKLDNETYAYNVTTAMHEPSIGQHRQIRSRVYADPGETGYMKTTIDDVRIK